MIERRDDRQVKSTGKKFKILFNQHKINGEFRWTQATHVSEDVSFWVSGPFRDL